MRHAPRKELLRCFAAQGQGLAMPMPIPAGSAAGTQDLQCAASIHEQMKIQAAEVSTPIPSWGPGPRCETCCPEVPRPIFPWSCNASRPQPNSWLDLPFSAAMGVWSPVDGAWPTFLTQPTLLRAQCWPPTSFPSFWPIILQKQPKYIIGAENYCENK